MVSASCFLTTGAKFKPRAGQGELNLSSLQWVDNGVPSLLRNLTLNSRQTDHLIGTSANAPQDPRSRLLSWALVFMGCCAMRYLYQKVFSCKLLEKTNNLAELLLTFE
ncbi:hypothetical protein TNCV_3711161 [Trichonephila clavipes]|uniref:Uncharacterized protein n=1 Tax=Trichonephila clavipes TaxID=2585209 RepID=A0A8X6V1G3_TRICX|nr:hypothetical protein TNCV_3711161 [Trichonephila clavipes]